LQIKAEEQGRRMSALTSSMQMCLEAQKLGHEKEIRGRASRQPRSSSSVC
jgi:hypothetical protein